MRNVWYIQILCLLLFSRLGKCNEGENSKAFNEDEVRDQEKSENEETSCSCGWTNRVESKDSIDGKPTGVIEYPFAVALIDTSKNKQFCGGTILTPRHVLTAAHCTDDFVDDDPPMAIEISNYDLHNDDKTDAAALIPVKTIYQHDYYSPRNLVPFTSDIAVLFLAEDIKFSRNVGPICFPQGRPNIDNETVTILGWGALGEGENNSSVLISTELQVIPYQLCSSAMKLSEEQTQICASGRQTGFCQVDSGGPVIWLDPKTKKYELVGITSFGYNCPRKLPGVYTDPTAYTDWINKQIEDSKDEELCH